MRRETIEKLKEQIQNIKNSGLSISRYFGDTSSRKTFANTISNFKKNAVDEEDYDEILDMYNSIVSSNNLKNSSKTTEPDQASYTRDENGKIISYDFKIYRKGKPALVGSLTREEMTMVYRLYTYYGANLTQREVTHCFSEYSLPDIKRIFRAFDIYKANSPFPPHYHEEYSVDELRDMQLREKENDFLKKAEEDRVKNNEKLLKKYAQENIILNEKLKNLSEFELKIPEITPCKIELQKISNDNILVLHLADIHLGSYVTTGGLYNYNKNYGKSEAWRRLNAILDRIANLGITFNTIVLNLLGDNVDCCGQEGYTGRMDHNMPENMDAREQGNALLEIITSFVSGLYSFTNNVKVYSVPEGNHGGNFEYFVTKYVLAVLDKMFGDRIKTTMFDSFYGCYKFKNQVYILSHGNCLPSV